MSPLWTGCHRLAPRLHQQWRGGGRRLRRGCRFIAGLPEEKKSKLNGSDNLQTFLAAAAQHSHGQRPPRALPSTTPATPAHAPAAPSRAFSDSSIIYGRLPTGAPLNALLRKPLMREKAPFLFLLSRRVLWDNIGHYEVWGIFPGTP